MFLQKIKQMSDDLGRDPSELNEVARESLLYGMKLNRKPGSLKRALRKIHADSTRATEDWRGNAYLLLSLPRMLVECRAKILNLDDYLFAREVLKPEHYKDLSKRLDNKPPQTTSDILKLVMPAIRKHSWRGRFLPMFDAMHGDMKDIEQDLAEISLVIINQEYNNFNSHKADDIEKYVGYCLGNKAATHLRSKAPRMMKVRVEDQSEMEHIMDEHTDPPTDQIASFEFRRDIENLLPERERNAVFLILGMADQELERKFTEFLVPYGKQKYDLTPIQLKRYVSKYLDIDVVELLKNSEELKKYLNR